MNDKNHHQEMDGIIITSTETIKSLIHEVRGRKVMLDHDLAAMYNVETKNLKRAVRSNIERFPIDFMCELSKDEYDSLRCKNSTLKSNGRGQHRKYLPFVFTQEGIAMLSGIIKNTHSHPSQHQYYEGFLPNATGVTRYGRNGIAIATNTYGNQANANGNGRHSPRPERH